MRMPQEMGTAFLVRERRRYRILSLEKYVFHKVMCRDK